MTSRKVVQGTCGWSDPAIFSCKRFYPAGVGNSSKEKLSFYSRRGGFGCAEVDASTYTILSDAHIRTWVAATPREFTFHVKAFSALCNNGVDVKLLPPELRPTNKAGWISLDDLGETCAGQLWTLFNGSLDSFIEAGKMGCVVFQFQIDFVPSEEGIARLERCARLLRPGVRMAVEFRCRQWLEEARRPWLAGWLRGLREGGVCLIASDDLECELVRGSERRAVMPLWLTATPFPALAYIRVHRREGSARVLSNVEVGCWAKRIDVLLDEKEGDTKTLEGPIYVLWGTDHEDQGVVNARRLSAALSPGSRLDWAAHVGCNRGTLSALWGKRSLSEEDKQSDESKPTKTSRV